jgi:hypothetical protein
MYAGKLVFAQVMEFAPWHTFRRLVVKYRGDFNVRTFSCLDQFLSMAFAQITFRESLRDIEACFEAHAAKAYHLGLRGNFTRSNLADANERCDWRLYCEFAQALIRIARKLYAKEPLGLELDNTVYALDSTTIDLCLTLFPWAPFRSTKAAIKLHTLLDLRGQIPSFIHISDGKLHDVNVLDILIPEAGAFYVMDRGYLDFKRLYTLHQSGGHFVTRAKRNSKVPAHCRQASRAQHGTGLRSDRDVERLLRGQGLSRAIAASPLPGSDDPQIAGLLDQSFRHSGSERLRVVQEPVVGRTLLQMDQATPADQAVLRHLGERREEPGVDRRQHLRAGSDRPEAAECGSVAAYDVASSERDAF